MSPAPCCPKCGGSGLADVNADDAGFSLCECVERKIDELQTGVAVLVGDLRKRKAVRR